VQWKAPSLDTAVLRYTDDQLKDILTYGRPFSPMPAWGIDGGGPMNEQQIDNLIRYLHKLADDQGSSSEQIDIAREASTKAAEAELERLNTLDEQLEEAEAKLDDPELSDEDREETEAIIARLEGEIAVGQEKTMGAALFNMNCARCHTQGWSYSEPTEPGGGGFGPPLYNVDDQFPEDEEGSIEDHIDFVTNGRKRGERYGQTGQASGRMPYFLNILTEEQILAIVEYERGLRPESEES
jgi:mono/diheme cytochrome c family protein